MAGPRERDGGRPPAAGRRLYVVRHGETEGESSVRLHGRSDVALSALGRAQVARLAPALRGVAFAAVVHSPLQRAAESARLLCGALELPRELLEVEPALREIDFGEVEGMTVAEIEIALPEWCAAWRRGEVDGYPGGDRIADFAARVGAGVRALLERHPRGDLLVVAHKGVVKGALAALCGLPWHALRELPIDLGSLWVLGSGSPWTIEQGNITGG